MSGGSGYRMRLASPRIVNAWRPAGRVVVRSSSLRPRGPARCLFAVIRNVDDLDPFLGSRRWHSLGHESQKIIVDATHHVVLQVARNCQESGTDQDQQLVGGLRRLHGLFARESLLSQGTNRQGREKLGPFRLLRFHRAQWIPLALSELMEDVAVGAFGAFDWAAALVEDS